MHMYNKDKKITCQLFNWITNNIVSSFCHKKRTLGAHVGSDNRLTLTYSKPKTNDKISVHCAIKK